MLEFALAAMISGFRDPQKMVLRKDSQCVQQNGVFHRFAVDIGRLLECNRFCLECNKCGLAADIVKFVLFVILCVVTVCPFR